MNIIPFVRPLVIQHQPIVLTGDLQHRLAALNRADRRLREMGLHSVWTRLAGPKPGIHIRRDHTVSIAPLLDQMGPRSFRKEDDCTVVFGEFDDVIVSWAEPN